MRDEWKLWLKILDKPIIRRDKFASLPLRQGNVDTVINPDPGCGRDFVGPIKQCDMRMKGRTVGQN